MLLRRTTGYVESISIKPVASEPLLDPDPQSAHPVAELRSPIVFCWLRQIQGLRVVIDLMSIRFSSVNHRSHMLLAVVISTLKFSMFSQPHSCSPIPPPALHPSQIPEEVRVQ